MSSCNGTCTLRISDLKQSDSADLDLGLLTNLFVIWTITSATPAKISADIFKLNQFPLFQTMVCVEQYLAVVQPVRFLQFKVLRYRLACVTAVWLLSFVFCAGCVVMQFNQDIFYITATEFLSMLLVMGFCCLSVLKTLTRPAPGARERTK
ncbi:unnamed protein product [Lota lota]